jgi:exodeoxyribonuclease VII small subunit
VEFIGGSPSCITRGTRVRNVAGTSGSAHASRKADHGDGQAAQQRPGFEQARDELIELVKRLEAGGLSLEQSLQLWERGEELAAICEEWLEGARARMATALSRQEESGETPAAPF